MRLARILTLRFFDAGPAVPTIGSRCLAGAAPCNAPRPLSCATSPPCPATCLCPGFGAATVLPMALTSFYAGAALVGVLFPLWIMMACDSNPRLVYQRGEQGRGRGTWVGRVLRHAGLMCLPSATLTLSRLVAWPAMRVQGVCERFWCFALLCMFLSETAAPPTPLACSAGRGWRSRRCNYAPGLPAAAASVPQRLLGH